MTSEEIKAQIKAVEEMKAKNEEKRDEEIADWIKNHKSDNMYFYYVDNVEMAERELERLHREELIIKIGYSKSEIDKRIRELKGTREEYENDKLDQAEILSREFYNPDGTHGINSKEFKNYCREGQEAYYNYIEDVNHINTLNSEIRKWEDLRKVAKDD